MSIFAKRYKLGLDIGSAKIKVCLPSSRGRHQIRNLDTPKGVVTKGVLQNPEEVSQLLGQWLKRSKLEHHMVVTTLPASTLVLRNIQLPKMKEKDSAEAIQWEAQRVLPFSPEEAQLDWVVQGNEISEEGEMQNILLIAVRESIVDRYVRAIRDAGLNLVAIDIAPMALGRWLLRSAHASSLIIDIGAELTQVHFFDSSRLVFSRSLSVGGVAATRTIASTSGLNMEEAEARKLKGEYQEEWLDAWHRELGRELQRSLDYYRSNFDVQKDETFEQVILTGGAALTWGIEALIKDITGVRPGFAEFSSREHRPRHEKIIYNVALGAGMWEGK